MVLQLGDHSTWLPKETVEDVLIKVGEFMFWIDFIVLETKVVASTKNKILLLLGGPLFGTSNSRINYRDEKMKLTFENMTIKLDVFNPQKQPIGFHDVTL